MEKEDLRTLLHGHIYGVTKISAAIDILWPHIEAEQKKKFNAGLEKAIERCETRINMQTPNLKISSDVIVELNNLRDELKEALKMEVES